MALELRAFEERQADRTRRLIAAAEAPREVDPMSKRARRRRAPEMTVTREVLGPPIEESFLDETPALDAAVATMHLPDGDPRRAPAPDEPGFLELEREDTRPVEVGCKVRVFKGRKVPIGTTGVVAYIHDGQWGPSAKLRLTKGGEEWVAVKNLQRVPDPVLDANHAADLALDVDDVDFGTFSTPATTAAAPHPAAATSRADSVPTAATGTSPSPQVPLFDVDDVFA